MTKGPAPNETGPPWWPCLAMPWHALPRLGPPCRALARLGLARLALRVARTKEQVHQPALSRLRTESSARCPRLHSLNSDVREGLDQAAPSIPPPARDGASTRNACRALAGCRPPHRARLDRPSSTARSRPSRRPTVSTRPAAGRGGGPAATGAPHVCGRHRVQRQNSSIGVDNKLGKRNAKPQPGLHTLAGGLSCAPRTAAAPLVVPESAWRLAAHTALGQLPTERNSVSRGPPDARSVA